MPIVEVENLTFSYDGDVDALKDVNFSVEEGSSVAIIGHNGSGKSTLAKVLMGLLAGFKGKVEIFGLPLDAAHLRDIRSRIGIVFQNPDNQFVGSTVADDIAFGLENHEVPHEDMQGIIESFSEAAGMKEFLDREPQNLSGGQKQRVAIAGVLAMKPDIIIFDEATAMLDPKGRKEIASMVSKMRKDNPKLTLISITHDVEEAARADEVIVLNGGHVVVCGTPEDVFAHKKELEEAHLSLPFFNTLRDELVSQGMNIPESIKNMEELEDYLCR